MREADKILYHLLNYERNAELLERIPHVPYLDLAIVFSRQEEGGKSRRLITGERGEESGWLEEMASVNTPRNCPVYFHTLDEVIREFEAEIGMPVPRRSSGFPMYLLTNIQKFLGASAMLYPGLLNHLARGLNENFYILPSSIHECILIPESAGCTREELKEMVRSVNDLQVPEQEILAYEVYYYCLQEDCIYWRE